MNLRDRITIAIRDMHDTMVTVEKGRRVPMVEQLTVDEIVDIILEAIETDR